MTGVAVKGQGAVLSVGNALSGSAIAVTGATNASPCVLTATNSFSNGDLLVVAGMSGITQINNRAFIASAVSGTSVALKGEDATGYGVFSAGGTVQKYTVQPVANITGVKGFDGTSSEIEVTHLLSAAKEFQLGLEDFGNLTVDALLINADVGQIYLRKLKSLAQSAPFSLVLSDGTTAAFMAFVKGFSFDGVKPDGAVTGEVTLRITNRPAWFS